MPRPIKAPSSHRCSTPPTPRAASAPTPTIAWRQTSRCGTPEPEARVPAPQARGKPVPRHIVRDNARRARIRSGVEHVFAAQKRRFILVIRTVGRPAPQQRWRSPTSPTTLPDSLGCRPTPLCDGGHGPPQAPSGARSGAYQRRTPTARPRNHPLPNLRSPLRRPKTPSSRCPSITVVTFTHATARPLRM